MTITGKFIRKHICISALSLALLPLAAGAQSQSQSGSASGSASGAGAGSGRNAAAQQAGSQEQGAGQQSSGASAKGAGTASGTGAGKTSYTPATAFVIVPLVSPVQDQWKKTGCWAKLHDNQNFMGDTLTLSGPIDMPDMVGPFGIDWKGKISSIETGSKATLVIYDNENYRDPVSTIKPGQRIADVSKRMGFFDEMSSLKITCPGMAAK